GASISWGVGDFLGGVSARRLPTFTVMAVSQVAGLAAVGVVVALLGESAPGTGGIAFAVAAGLGGILGLAALYRGMAVGAIAIVAPISAASAVVPLAVGLARGERPGTLQLAGVGLVLLGVALTSYERGPGGRRLAAGAGLAVLSAIGFGLYYVFIAEAGEDSALWAVLVARAVSSLVAVGVFAAGRGRSWLHARDVPVLTLIGFFDVGANCLLVLALNRGLVSLVPVLASLYPVTTVLLARAVLGERIAREQQSGVALAFTGVALISAG
ncbi:MAG TPA: DMT family transporter, partial [Gaiellaceae bacterium]|nr:DMT family transporter [Gaiellaceae bacterium]